MNIAEEAFQLLYPDEQSTHRMDVRYHGKFSAYNGNVRYTRTHMTFNLSKEWRYISKDIKIGLIQSLLLKTRKEKRNTLYIDLYNIFLKNAHKAIPKDTVDPFLKERFDVLNDAFFNGMMDMPNLRWGKNAMRTLGTYQYGSDTVTISSILKESPGEMLDYVLYHELLHKKHKYNHNNNRSHHHTPAFREDEKKFPRAEQLEKELGRFLEKKRVRRWLWF